MFHLKPTRGMGRGFPGFAGFYLRSSGSLRSPQGSIGGDSSILKFHYSMMDFQSIMVS
jgi:hypothetical protein